MRHLQHEKDIKSYQGAQVPLIEYDELTHFQRRMFTYMLSRGRTDSGITPYIRAGTNPTFPDDPIGGWIHDYMGWYINQETGYTIPERSGVLRWFVMIDNRPRFGSRRQLTETYPDLQPLSFTFILSRLKDNQVLLKNNPRYKAQLLGLPYLDRMQLYGSEELGGNWLVAPRAGTVINKAWFETLTAAPIEPRSYRVRFWDFAGTSPRKAARKKTDPDYTASTLMDRIGNRFFVLDSTNERVAPHDQDRYFVNVSEQDAHQARIEGVNYMVRFEVEPGSAAQREAARLIGLLTGIDAAGVPSNDDKLTRLKPFSAQADAGNVFIIEAPWNKAYLAQLHNFPDGNHDDMVDTTSGAFNVLAEFNEKVNNYHYAGKVEAAGGYVLEGY